MTSERVTLGSRVEYVGEDIPEIQVWRGHPGVVVDLSPDEVTASMVGGPSMCFGHADLRTLNEDIYRLRGERIVSGIHPLDDREVGNPITDDGSHWP